MNSTNNKAEKRISLSWIAFLRIMLGVLFLTTWGSNMSKGFYTPEGLHYFFTDVFPQKRQFFELVRCFYR